MYTASFYIEPQDILSKLSEEDRKRFNNCVFYDAQIDMKRLRITCLLIEDNIVNEEPKYSSNLCNCDNDTISISGNRREILGNNLEQFFSHIDKYGVESSLTYKGERYEVWEVDDDLFPEMRNMSEEKFLELAGEDAWWRIADGSNLGSPYEKNTVNGHILISWNRGCFDNETSYKTKKYESLSSYLCDCIGASQPKNVCALAMDLAKYNSMTMSELFTKYEGY